MAALLLFGFLSFTSLPVVAQTQSEDQTQLGAPAEISLEATEDENGQGSGAAASGLAPSNRPSLSEEPVASEGWAEASFTGFIDISQRLKQPNPQLLENGLRFLTSDGFPPFNYRDKSGEPMGYHVELARAFCEQLNLACTIKVVPFEDIPDMILGADADVALTGLTRHPDLEGRLAFSNTFLKRPGRFLRLKDKNIRTDKQSLDGAPVAVIGGTSHEAFLKAYFERVNRVPVTDLKAARQLLEEEKVVAIFADAFQLLPFASERNSPFSFAGKPYYDDYFFGDGMSMAYGDGRNDLANLLNYGLQKLAQKGRLAELYARHFALDVYAQF
ncbi:transporter substrate-binding domain-containing protein [uncultured Cohaesibacter sp.]|uniref:transporter substrate-binding domain-containing protein n=1 Tax=uncultured Cohaesibacter sp. TaxID=1002546 RepID=UPI00292D1B70|nr:transporter substrate-binding domain-containing protein [uncultured Cohaesibacter sp.]